MDILDALIILVAGFISGFMNTVAGGGSLLTLPILIFMGLPSSIANATNRVAIFTQNVFAVSGFKSKGLFNWSYSLWLGTSAIFGAIIGAKITQDEALGAHAPPSIGSGQSRFRERQPSARSSKLDPFKPMIKRLSPTTRTGL